MTKCLIKIILLTMTSTITLGTYKATAAPTPNSQGDYYLMSESAMRRIPGHWNWLVIDGDIKGLNCRMAKQFQSVVWDGADAPDETDFNNRYSIADWTVMFTFKKGQRLKAVTTMGKRSPIAFRDNLGKPWLPISLQKGNRSISCFVRANSRFIKPLKEDQNSGRPLE